MNIDQLQLDELAMLCESVSIATEGGFTYLLLKGLKLPVGCQPSVCDALLCPMVRDGYNSRLFFSERVSMASSLNWTSPNPRILDRNWNVYSWRTPTNLRLAQMVAIHLRALQQHAA